MGRKERKKPPETSETLEEDFFLNTLFCYLFIKCHIYRSFVFEKINTFCEKKKKKAVFPPLQ